MNIAKTSLLLAACAAVSISCGKQIEFDACGQIDATQVTVSAESSGRILSFNLEEGESLAPGQVLGAIDSIQTSLQIAELKERIKGAQARLIDIERQLEPQMSQLESLEKDYSRFSTLLGKEAATEKQVDDLDNQVRTLKAQIAAQKQSWERNNSAVRAEIGGYRVQLAQKQDQLSKCIIRSPQKGIVLTKYAEAGENVSVGKPLFKLADLSRVYVRAYFTTAQLSGLKIGDKVSVIPDDGSASPRSYEGTISWISDQAEFTPKNIQTRDERADLVYAVKVSVPNDGSLRLGMYAYLRK